MKAYRYARDKNEHYSEIIYHNTAKEAKKLGISKIGYENDFLDIQCTRYPDADQYAKNKTEPEIERNDKILRRLGWHYEDEYTCGSCGLGALGMEEFEVCANCWQCRECACDDDCKGMK